MNAKQNEIHAAMALAALDDVHEQVELNRRRYARYRSGLADVPGIRLVLFDERERNGYKNIVVELLAIGRSAANSRSHSCIKTTCCAAPIISRPCIRNRPDMQWSGEI